MICVSYSMFCDLHNMFSFLQNISKRKTIPVHLLLRILQGFFFAIYLIGKKMLFSLKNIFMTNVG